MEKFSAETLALRALAYIASREDVLERMLAVSGLEPAEVKARAAEPDFLAGVLDYLLGEEPLLLRFCEDEGINPSWPARARLALPHGRAEEHP
ncbi:MAG: DUF3572 domain-containing protein [Alphaproteobacteria bacterium]|nr:DUF3572 domain-containing protein [Alphaproteobacteria bacterium]